jgi:hypothetical protein
MRAFLQNCPRDYNDDIDLQNNPLARQTMNHQVTTNVSSRECVREHSHSKARHVSQSTVGTAQNVPVHFGSKVRQSVETVQNVPVHFVSKGETGTVETAQNVPVHFVSKGETAQNVPVHFGSKVKHVSWSPIETVQNVPVHFGSQSLVKTAQNVPVHFGSKVRKRPKCTTTF